MGQSDVPPTAMRGQIVAHLGVAVDVALESGELKRVRVSRRAGHVVGDLTQISGERLIRLERHSELRRRAPGRLTHQVIAANISHLGIVTVAEPPPRIGFIDRAMILARLGNIRPFLIVNKLDQPEGQAYFEELQAIYENSCPLFGVSATTGHNMNQLRQFLAQAEPSVLIGPSGVGKSTITNCLIPSAKLTTGALSEATGRGRHTTSVATLQKNDDGLTLVDTPGVRDYGLIELTATELAEFFPGFEDVEHSCQFRNCRHRREPGCAVTEQANANERFAKRVALYHQLLDEVEDYEEQLKSKGQYR